MGSALTTPQTFAPYIAQTMSIPRMQPITGQVPPGHTKVYQPIQPALRVPRLQQSQVKPLSPIVQQPTQSQQGTPQPTPVHPPGSINLALHSPLGPAILPARPPLSTAVSVPTTMTIPSTIEYKPVVPTYAHAFPPPPKAPRLEKTDVKPAINGNYSSSPMDEEGNMYRQRAHFTDSMRLVLDSAYRTNTVGEEGYKKFTKQIVAKLSRELGLTKVQVKQWCRNRNKRERAKMVAAGHVFPKSEILSRHMPSFVNVHNRYSPQVPYYTLMPESMVRANGYPVQAPPPIQSPLQSPLNNNTADLQTALQKDRADRDMMDSPDENGTGSNDASLNEGSPNGDELIDRPDIMTSSVYDTMTNVHMQASTTATLSSGDASPNMIPVTMIKTEEEDSEQPAVFVLQNSD